MESQTKETATDSFENTQFFTSFHDQSNYMCVRQKKWNRTFFYRSTLSWK